MKFTLIPNSFKGTLSSSQICAVTDEKIKKHFPDSLTIFIPVVDRGEGSVDAFTTIVGSVREYVAVRNPYSEDMESYFGLIDTRQTIIIKTASYAGLPLVEDRGDPRLTTAYGAGQPALAATRKDMKKVIVDLRGSSTNDGGRGAVAMVGIRFYDRDGRQSVPTGGATIDIGRIDLSERDSLLEQVEITTMCDIDNPMYRPVGTSFTFGPQKRTDEVMVLQLDKGIRNLSRVIAQATGTDISQVPGARAAGAIGVGVITSFGSGLQMGAQTVLDTMWLDEIIDDTDYILTDGSKLDSQSLRDKVAIGIAGRAKRQTKSVIAVAGEADNDEIEKIYDVGMTTAFPTNRFPQGFSVSRHHSQENLACMVDNIIRLIKAGRGEH